MVSDVSREVEGVASDEYDVVVVGARCAGAPTAMQLARRGYRTLLVDKATFPSDTLSTHLIHPPGVAALRRWGLLDRLTATGCPPIHTYAFDFGDLTLAGSPGLRRRSGRVRPPANCPRQAARRRSTGRREPKSAKVSAPMPCFLPDGRVVGIHGRDGRGRTVVERRRGS